jgi:hypothetical protein
MNGRGVPQAARGGASWPRLRRHELAACRGGGFRNRRYCAVMRCITDAGILLDREPGNLRPRRQPLA